MSTEDFSHTAAFLDCLAPGEQHHTFQTFHDQGSGAGAVVHGTIAHLAPYLRAQQAQGHGVFWTVNRTDGAGRELANITSTRAVWLDIDEPGRDIAPICAALAPHCVVESSPGKHHLYWRVDDLPLADAQPLLRALRLQWGGDPGATGVNRVLRLPGFWHLKTATPHYTRIVAWNPALPAYHVTHITQHLLGGLTPAQLETGEVDTNLHAGPVEGWRNAISDQELQGRLNGQIASPVTAAQAFGTGERWTLHELWAPDMHGLEASGQRSEARMALLTRLMYLTGGDSARVHALVHDHVLAVKDGRQGLLMRELGIARSSFLKWWEPEYVRRQAQLAETKQLAESAGPGVSVTPTVMDMEAMYGGLAYIARGKGVVVRATKQVFKLDDASIYFAASKHEGAPDDSGKVKKVSNLSTWLADPERRLTAGLLTWRPSQPEFCEPLDHTDGHGVAYNTWRGLRTVHVPEGWQQWAAWFQYHLTYLVPIEAERTRFLQWLAHIAQRPGELPQTAYVMVTETTGTGRNWLAGVLGRVFAGYTALGVDLGPILDGDFNGILSRKLLATVDEVRSGGEGDRYGRAEALKSTINSERRNINEKYGQQMVEENCCRWLIFSNHKADALPIDQNDRRIIVIENPSHRLEPDYYSQLYALLPNPNFIASVRHLLDTTDISSFNPGAIAPMNEAKQRMQNAMVGIVDRAIESFMRSWQEKVATMGDLMRHVQTVTGEKPKAASIRYAMKRTGVEVMPDPVTIDGAEEVPIWWGGKAVDDPIGKIKAARARRAFVVVK